MHYIFDIQIKHIHIKNINELAYSYKIMHFKWDCIYAGVAGDYISN